ncbi:Bug family tripartite tricarboxylate transporter substrate binding protein, partial [Hydrogenophaga sp.]
WSQDAYPARPVKLIVPFPPGGPTDIMGRTAAKAMGDALGQSFVVENKAGAGGNIGTDAVAKAAPDGYTIGLSAISSLAIAPYLYDKLPFQVEKDFAPISLVGTTPCVIVVHPSAPFADLKGLVAYAKANPGKLGYATSGIGTSNHLAAELLQSVAGIELTNIPYKGSSQIVPDLLSGTVIMSMESSLATTLQHIRSGKLKALAVTSPTRAKALPDVPTVAESGYPGFAVETWFGLVAPAATPAAVVQKLHDAWAKGAKTAEAQAAFDNISGNLRVTTP